MSGKILSRVSALSLVMLLAACGGDGDSVPLVGGDDDQTESGDTDSGTGGTDTDGDVTTPTDPDVDTTASTLALGTGEGGSFRAGTLGAESTTLISGEKTELRFNIVDSAKGNTKALRTESSILFTSACLDAANRAVIENAPTGVNNGTVLATYNSGTCLGDDTVYAFLDGSTKVYASETITISPATNLLALGILDGTSFAQNKISTSASQALPIGSTVRLGVNVYDTFNEELTVGQPFTVEFFATCAKEPNESNFSQEQVSTTTGIAETIYTIGSCKSPGQSEQQTVSAQLVVQNSVLRADTEIKVVESNAFQLVAAIPDPQSIAPSNLSQPDRQTTSIVSFTLENSAPVPEGVNGKTVTLKIDEPGVAEFSISGGGTADTLEVTTDNSGQVSARVRALKGIDQQVFRVIASYDGLETLSPPIAVNSKLPYEPKFSISTTNFAPDVQGKDGVQITMTVLAADDKGNRIRGNTPVNFSTTEGSIDPDCQLDEQGRCTITWESLSIDNAFTEVTATTHGRRENGTIGQISDSVSMLMSTSDEVKVELTATPPTLTNDSDEDSYEYCATTWVTLPGGGTTKYSPPTGTEIEFEAVEGEFINDATSSSAIGSDERLLDAGGYKMCTDVTPLETKEQVGDGNGGTEDQTTLSIILSVTVTTPGDNPDVATFLAPPDTATL